MKHLTRLAACAAASFALLGAALAAAWAFGSPLATDLLSFPVSVTEAHEAGLLREELWRKGERAAWGLGEKNEAARALAEGRVGLGEAADRFLAVNAGDAALARQVREIYHADSDAEAARRQALDWARAYLARQPAEQTREAWARLGRGPGFSGPPG